MSDVVHPTTGPSATLVAEQAPAAPDAAHPRPQRVVPLRRPGRWAATVAVLVLLAQFTHGLVTNPFFQWDRFGYWFTRPVILDGLKITLEVTALSAVVGLFGGLVLALMRLSRSPVLLAVSWGYVWFFRSVPLLVLLLFLYNFGAIYPTLGVGVPFGPTFTSWDFSDLAQPLALAVLGLGLHEAAYVGELIRGGILAVDQGQHEASAALGLPRSVQLRRVILPQALRTIVPSYVNLLIGLLKASALVYFVGLLDLFGTVLTMSSTYPGDTVPLLVVGSVWYLVLTSVLSVVQFYVERYYARGAVRTLPPTPLQRVRTGVAGLHARVLDTRNREIGGLV